MKTDDLLVFFQADMQSRNLSKDTIGTYIRALRNWDKFLQSRGVALEKASREDLRAYLDQHRVRGISRRAVKGYFSAISCFYDYLVYEEKLPVNPVTAVKKRYLQAYKDNGGHTHQLVTVEQAAVLVEELSNPRDKALLMLMFKTGIRCREMLALDVTDINFENQSITLKPTAKRSNRVVFFDDECENYLRRWMRLREYRNLKKVPALFVTSQGRLSKSVVDAVLREAATRLGLNDRNCDDLENHFTAHCCRHWFTTYLDRAGMKREHIQFLRGDAGGDAIDIYIHNDMEKIRKEYLACIPILGV
jgi:integrase/recombinase XerD